jgi:hypothetical protein
MFLLIVLATFCGSPLPISLSFFILSLLFALMVSQITLSQGQKIPNCFKISAETFLLNKREKIPPKK